MSMQVVLAGLFPPRGTAMEWNRRLNWQPIPIFSEPLDEDTVSIDMISFHLNETHFISFVKNFEIFSLHHSIN